MKITSTEINAITGEETITQRDLTKEELADKKLLNDFISKRQAEAETKATAKAAIADRLGLTADELQVLLG